MFVLLSPRSPTLVPAFLALRNFLCYRDNCPPIDFTGIQVACLTGENGNGKSALLDAITWALWGQARARSDDELIHLGRTEMEVEFEFFGGEQRYRVIRKRKKGTQRTPGATSLEFHLATQEGWRALTANHVRDTERKVREVLKLDYETFINSAFLLQGRADTFTLKTPGERKRILAEILGLSQYDELEQEARFERGLRDDEARALERELHDISNELAQETGYLTEKAGLTTTLGELEEDLARESERVERLRQAERLLGLQREQAAAAERRRADAEMEVKRAGETLRQHEQALAAHQAMLASATAIEDGYARLQLLRTEERELDVRFREHAALTQDRAGRQAAVERVRLELVAEERRLADSVERLTSAIESGRKLEPARLHLAERAEALQKQESRLGALRTEEQGLIEQIGGLRSENAALRVEMDAIKLKQTELSTATVCPLCKTELGEAGQRHVVEAYELEGRRLASDFRAKRTQIQEGEARVATVRKEIEALDAHVRQAGRDLARETEAVDVTSRAALAAAEQLGSQATERAALRSRLDRGDYARDDQARLQSIEGQIAALGYDAERHQQVRHDVEEFLPFEQRYRDLGVARVRWESEQAALRVAEQGLQGWIDRLAAATREAEQAQALVAQQPDTTATLAEARRRLELLQSRQRALQQALGAVEQKLDDCARQRRIEATKSAALKHALEERRIYEELTAAFSRRGIQALIIDSALPEITEEANRLLGRMTNNRLRIMMDTQRQTQKGTVAETLDIRISDELGTRNYELFSGGEAFRVNLALRIALSKLLARRAGAPLPTLVIDEGFGSQDAAALERLIEAINIIQSDFRCLLVITHLAELRDQFPVQIVVSKTADGSIATVNA